MEQIVLRSEEIHLWLTFYDELSDPELHSAYRELLTPAERKQESRFYFELDRRRHLITRALVRTTLSRYLDLDPTQWEFCTNAYGRPEIANAEARPERLSFNISHTPCLIVLGVARGRVVGVDVENPRQREAAIGIAGRYFAAEEIAALAVAPPSRKQHQFFEYWTFKEAYIKARGMGLSLPLDKVSFHFPDAYTVRTAIHPDMGDKGTRWQFWQFGVADEYLIAVCAERMGAGTSRVTTRRVVPLVRESNSPLRALRSSESAMPEN